MLCVAVAISVHEGVALMSPKKRESVWCCLRVPRQHLPRYNRESEPEAVGVIERVQWAMIVNQFAIVNLIQTPAFVWRSVDLSVLVLLSSG